MTDLPADAGLYVTSPSTTLGAMDFHPLATGAAWGKPVDLSAFAAEDDYDLDFDGRYRGVAGWRGAYAGPAQGPSWRLTASRKPLCRPPGPDQRRTMPPPRACHNRRSASR